MRRANRLRRLGAVAVAGLAWPCVALGTPSSTYWTNATTDVQAFRTLHVGVDNYFTIFRSMTNSAGAFPTDVGLTVGVLPFTRLQMEVGIDGLEPADHPWYLNAKMGTPEHALFPNAPAVAVGVFNVGTRAGGTDQDVVLGQVGKTIHGLGRVFVGGYTGNRRVLRDHTGKAAASGVMVAFDHGMFPMKGTAGYDRIVVAGDYASGNNALGGGGIGLYYYFSSTASLLVGPVFFNDRGLNGPWKWTTQFDANVPF